MKTRLSRRTTIVIACLLMAAGLAPAAVAAPSRATTPLVQVGSSAKFGNILVNGQGMTLYALSSEAGGTIHCSGGCLSVWLPVLVPAGGTAPTSVTGASGTFGTLTRPEGMQVTYNGFPVYTFVNDKAPGDTNGDGIVATALGGTWHLMQISSVPLAATAVERLSIHITATGATVWGRVTARYALNGKLVQRTCARATCQFPVPLGARISFTQSPTNVSTWPFAEWKFRAVPGKASARIVKRPAASLHINNVYRVTAVYVVASAGGGYGG
jgi:predicted lipoprotein with Yx(FWY)xxD motif